MEQRDARFKYADIIDLPHHVSPIRPRMSREERGAQFAPIAALTGHSGAIAETARLTEQRIELTEGAKEELDRKLIAAMEQGCSTAVTYFVQDSRKQGGCYRTACGSILRADRHRGSIFLSCGTEIPLEDICEIEPGAE